VVGVMRREYSTGGFAAAKEAYLTCVSGMDLIDDMNKRQSEVA